MKEVARRSEIDTLLRRQTQWQRERARLPWAEKIRQAERLRASLLEWRRLRTRTPVSAKPLPP